MHQLCLGYTWNQFGPAIWTSSVHALEENSCGLESLSFHAGISNGGLPPLGGVEDVVSVGTASLISSHVANTRANYEVG